MAAMTGPPSKGQCTMGVVYHYCGESSTPREDGILQAPFDDPTLLAANVENGVVKAVEVDMFDGRVDNELMGKVEDMSPMAVLDTRGMMLVPHQSTMTTFWDQDALTSTHYSEMQRLAQELTGCDRTAVGAHALRGMGELGRPVARFVHNDFSDRFKPLFQELVAQAGDNIVSTSIEQGGLGITADQLQAGHLVMLNFWRPMQREPLQRNPLAIIDSTTMQGDEIVQFPHFMSSTDPKYGSFAKRFRIPMNPHVNVGNRASAQHKWFYFPGMTRDEVLAFKNYDSDAPQPDKGIGMHASFDDPNTPDSAPIRESVEIRVACFWFADNC